MSRKFRLLVLLTRGPARFSAGSAALTLALTWALPVVPHAQATPPAPSTEAAPSSAPSTDDAARRKQVLAKVEGVEITVGKVEDFLAGQSPIMRERYRPMAERQNLVANMVRLELLAAEAARRGYDKNQAVVRTVKDSSVQALLRSEIDAKYSPQNLSADEVKAYYEANSKEFHQPAKRRASQIVVTSADEAKKLLPEALKADARAFIELARQHSTDAETKLRGGDLGWFPRELIPGGSDANIGPAVRGAVFALKNTGDTASQPIAVDGGFAIVRLTGERPERNTDLAEADSSIRAKLWREKRQQALEQLLTSLRAKDKVQVFAERADLVKFDDMDKRPGGFEPERPGPGAASKPGAQPTRPHP